MTPVHGDGQPPEHDPLWSAFIDPPDEARPRAWWHWMDGNIDPAGIARDLTWLHEAGIRGVQLFDGGMGVPLVVPEAVRPGSATWVEAIDTAVRTADKLALELAVATSSGWSAAGGPWVRPEDAMKKVVWSEAVIEGGQLVESALPPLPAVAGPYQDCPRWGSSPDPRLADARPRWGSAPDPRLADARPRWGASSPAPFAIDWVVLAVPHDRSSEVLAPMTVTASAPLGDWAGLVDSSFEPSVALPRDPDAWSLSWIKQSFDEPVTARSVVIGLPGPRGFGAAPPPDALLQASDDGVSFRDVVRLDPTTVPVRSASFAPVTARHFRLVLTGGSASDALPPMADGVRPPPVLRPSHEFRVSEFALRTGGRVHNSETKAGFGVVGDYYDVDTDPRAAAGAVDAGTVIDLTPMTADGVLRWDAPPGRWRILRMGASLTGQTNGPAPADSTGLEVDKLDGARIAAYLETHLARFGDRSDAATTARSRFPALLSDSIESGAQNWTDRIRAHFASRRGYDPLPWLPTLTGQLIGGAAESDRFLFDYRRTLAELFADEYYGTLSTEAHRRGMRYYAEALEDGRPQLGDDLSMRSHADVPMGAMWTFDPEEGPRPTYVADLKGASSVAHVYGKSHTGSEAFSSFGNPWSSSPQALKHVADLQLTLGVTRFCIHTSPHQPLSALAPGIALAPFLGQAFTINETWASMARPWIDYLARCGALLSKGRPAVEIAVFVGEEGPVTGLFDDALDDSVPVGFDFDYIGADALTDVLRVEEGQVVAEGASYRLLYLGGSTRRMTLAALAQIERLLDAGATVVGFRPEASPSLADDPRAFQTICDRLWSPGRVMPTNLRSAILALRMRPALEVGGAPVRRIARIVDGRRVTFLANPSAAEIRLLLAPADGAPLVGWDPVELRRVPLESLSTAEGTAFVAVLAAFGSLFVVDEAEEAVARPEFRIPLEGAWRVAVPGGEALTTSPEPRRWTEFGERERGFSGTGVYRHQFTLSDRDAGASGIRLEFASVDDIARVVVNGKDCGVVWTAPFRIDVTEAVCAGANSLEVHVATPWRNRLIAEASTPTGEIFEPMTAVFDATATPLPAGLAGPVSLVIPR